MNAPQRRLDIEEINDVTVAKFVDRKILDEANIQIIGNQLFGMVDADDLVSASEIAKSMKNIQAI